MRRLRTSGDARPYPCHRVGTTRSTFASAQKPAKPPRVNELRNPFAGRNPLFGAAVIALTSIAAAEFLGGALWIPLALVVLGFATFLVTRRRVFAWLVLAAAFYALHLFQLRPPSALALASRLSTNSTLVRATGLVIDEPRTREESRFYRFTLQLEEIVVANIPLRCRAQIVVAWPDESPAYGDRVEIVGSARNIARPRNPGQFDLAGWLKRRGILSQITVRDIKDARVLEATGGNWLVALSHRFRKWTQQQLRVDLEESDRVAAIISSMVLGTQDEAADQLAESFRQTGTFHLFAVSGFNVAILALLVQQLLQPFGLHRGKMSPVIIIPILVFYALVTGLGASSVRATLMAAVLLAAAWSDRPARLLNSLGAAAVLILAWDTNQLFNAGFQLSFFVVFSLLALAEVIHYWIRPIGAPDAFLPRSLWSRPRAWADKARLQVTGLLAASLAAWVGSAPLMLYHFHYLTPVGILANLVAVPLATIILGLGILTLLGAWASTAWAAMINNTNWLVTKVLLASVNFFAAVPGGHFHCAWPSFAPKPACEIVVHDFDRSSVILVRAGAETWLFGCGHASDFERGLRPGLFARGLDGVTGLIATVPSSAHLGAIDALLAQFAVERFIDSPLAARLPDRHRLHEWLADARRGKSIYARGQIIFLDGGIEARVLHPPAGLDRRLSDDQALVLRLHFPDGRRVLFMSDSGFATERWLIENAPDLRSDVLVFGQHSRDLTGTPEFVRAVAPKCIVRHEHSRRFRQPDETFQPPVNALVLRTVEEGAITLRFFADHAEVGGFVSQGTRPIPR